MPSKTPKAPDASLFLEELKKRVTIPEGAYEDFLASWQFRQFKKNEVIQQGGEVPRFIVFVLKGCLRQYIVTESGEEHIVYFAEERHWIGDVPNLRAKTPTSFTMQTIEKCELLLLPAEHYEEVLSRFPWWAEAHSKGFQRWAIKLQEQMAASLIESGETKYLRLMKERPSLFQRVPQHYIASYLGISPETLSRIRKKIYNL